MITATHRKYAQALGEVAVESRLETEVLEQLQQFQQLVAEHRELRETLASPAYPLQVKREIIGKVADALRLHDIVRNFLLLLEERGRLRQLPEIVAAYQRFLDDRRGIVQVEATLPNALDEQGLKGLEERLKRVLARPVRLHVRVDESLIGGIVVQIGSTVFDGSVRAALRRVRERLVSS
ncbi:MAG: F0F1 ATP synthase subunit delta [Acidobacteriota bacterium]